MKVTINGVDRSSSYQQEELESIQIALVADKGEPGVGSAPVPDPSASQSPWAGQKLVLEVGTDLVATTFLGGIDRDRSGIAAGTGGRLVNHHHIIDENAQLNGYVALQWKRPAESDYERISAFITAFLGHLSLDTTWVLNTLTAPLPAKTYLTEGLYSELQEDCGNPTGKTLFIERGRIHWHLPTAGITAGITIVEAENANYSTSYPLLSRNPPVRTKDPMDLATKVYARNDRGQVRSATDATAVARHDAAGLRHERLVEEPSGSTAQLTTLAATTLADNKAERITYEGEIGPLTAAQLALIPAGALITVTDHVWGLSSSVQRIAAETIRYAHPDQFFVGLQLGYPIRIRAKPIRHTQPPKEIPPYICDPANFTVPHCDDPLDTSPIVAVAGQNGDLSPKGIELIAGATYHVRYQIVHATTNFECNLQVLMTAGGATQFGGLNAGHDPAIGGGQDPTVYPPVTFHEFDVAIGTTGCYKAMVAEGGGYAGCNIIGTTMTVGATWLSGPDTRFDSLEACPPPLIGQDVREAGTPGDGSTTTGTTNYPYQPGSLIVTVGGVDVVAEETNPAAGTYTLPMAPPVGITPVVRYRAADTTPTGQMHLPPLSVLDLIPDDFLPPLSASARDFSVNVEIDGGGLLTPGLKAWCEIPVAGTIIAARLVANVSGSAVVDIWKETYAGVPATVADTITASAKPTLSSAQKYQDTTLTGWIAAVAAGNWLYVNLDSVAGISFLVLSLTIRRA